jgi:hypothetical protein
MKEEDGVDKSPREIPCEIIQIMSLLMARISAFNECLWNRNRNHLEESLLCFEILPWRRKWLEHGEGITPHF